MKVAIPRMGETVAPCLEYSATISIFTVDGEKVVDQLDFPITSREPLDRIRLLRDQAVETIICGGVQDVFADIVRASGIRIMSWVSGNIDELLGSFLKGRLTAERSTTARTRDTTHKGKGKPKCRHVSTATTLNKKHSM